MTTAEFDEFVLTCMPTFIAINYQRLLEAQEPQEQVALILHIYNLGLRALTINLVSQYLFRDRGQVRDPYLENLLEQKFPHLTADAWEDMLFTALRAYQSHRTLFFMPELYDFYWDTSTHPHRRRADVKRPFDRLTQATQDLQTDRLVPQEESGWQALAAQLRERLHEILQSLSFIGTYDLIHVLAQDEQTYTFELHKGMQVVTDQRLLPQHAQLNSDWFYLRAGTEELLPLHPLLIFWKDSIEPTDTGVFDRWIQERLKYLLATPGQIRFDEKRVRDFVKLIYFTIKEAVGEQERDEKLTWVQLCDLCEKITSQYMATVRGKYHQQLYLQRDTARQHVEAFLADPKKRGFVLVGKSGVGKSNFLLALAEELHQSRDDVCVLMYDGANLPIASSTLTQIISQDFSNRGFLSRQPLQQVWWEISQIGGIDERLVVVCLDAVNENAQATELLRQLDTLVQSPWPWLKVVLSSRPETWKEIKRGVKLAEVHYYQKPGTETLDVELEPFSYSEEMDPFTPQELPKVYSKYQQEFYLQTPYETLSHELREILRDPLQLRLLAKTYQRQAIPEHVKVSTLIEQYVNAVLQRDERRFVENQLVPMMVRERHYNNVITEAELDAAGGALYDMIYSNQQLSNGQRMNQTFLNVCDADILVLQEQGTEQRIGFKYERFYEYFTGKRILRLSETQADRYAFFRALVEETTGKKETTNRKETTGKPFLWGAVRNALVEEAKKPNSETILKLCRTTQQHMKEMMVNVLITLGLDDPEPVEGILRNLLPQEKQATEWRKGRQLVRKTPEALDVPSRNAGRIAVEVASSLGIAWVLQRAALQEDQSLRTAAVRYSYYLWQHDQAQGFAILEHLAQHAVSGFLPNVLAFEAVFGLSLTIFFDHSRDEAARRRLQSCWRGIIAKLLGLREKAGRWESVVRARIRESLFSFITTLAFRILREHPWYSMVNNQSLEAFFQLGVAEKALYRHLVHYLDVQGNYPREQMENDFLTAITMSDILIYLVTDSGLIAHGIASPLAFLPFLKKLFEAAKGDARSYPYLADITDTLHIMLLRDPNLDELFAFFLEAVEVCHTYYARYPQALRSSSYGSPEVLYLGPYIYLQYHRTGSVRSAWLEKTIQAAFSRGDAAFFETLLTQELTYVGIVRQKPRIALDALALFFKDIMKTPSERSPEIRKLMQAFLGHLRLYYPDEVDDFLEEQQALHDFRLQVQTNEPAETIGAMVGDKARFFVIDDVLMDSPNLLAQFMRILETAAEYKNARTWFDYFFREVINLIYGGEALRPSA